MKCYVSKCTVMGFALGCNIWGCFHTCLLMLLFGLRIFALFKALASCWMSRQVIHSVPFLVFAPTNQTNQTLMTSGLVSTPKQPWTSWIVFLFGCLNEIVCHCSRQFVWALRISRWCIPPSLSSFCCSWSSPVNLLSMERWRPNTWPMLNTTRWVSVLFPPHMVFTFSSVFKMVDLLLFCLSWSLLFYDSPYIHLSSSSS